MAASPSAPAAGEEVGGRCVDLLAFSLDPIPKGVYQTMETTDLPPGGRNRKPGEWKRKPAVEVAGGERDE